MIPFKTEALALLIGLLFGVSTGVLKLPIPAPPKIAGVLGIVGIYIGYKLTALL